MDHVGAGDEDADDGAHRHHHRIVDDEEAGLVFLERLGVGEHVAVEGEVALVGIFVATSTIDGR